MENYNREEYEKNFTKPIIKYGKLTNLIAVPLCFIPSLAVWFIYGVIPPLNDILTGWGLIASIYLIYAIIEPISYYPLVGLPGTYMVCLSGNIGNVRVPCSAIAQESVGTIPGTKKAELVSTLGIAGSIVTNIIVVTIAAIGGAWLMKLFPPIVLEALEYVTPAIFGAMFGMNAIKNLKYSSVATFVAFICFMFFNIPPYILIPGLIFITVVYAFADHSYKKKKGENHGY